MIRSIAVTLGISAVFAGSIAKAQNNPIQLSQLENRSFAEDKKQFFPKIIQKRGLDFSDNEVGRISKERSELDFLGEDIIIETGDIRANSTESTFDTSTTGDRSDETQVLFPINKW
ncbi:MAG: hypothetical protein AAGF26_14810 [Cyanobacteria bacterium P01_G01_bin.49]